MKTIAIIPARMGSQRLPGKPLIEVKGKPILQYVWDNITSSEVDFKIIATDDEKILKAVESFGGRAMLTKSSHQNGSERCTEVLEQYPDFDIVLNIQGDEPMVNNRIVTALLNPFKEDPLVEVSTLKTPLHLSIASDPNIVKVVTDSQGFALYFSRSIIPYEREHGTNQKESKSRTNTVFKHLGFYAFKKNCLLEYVNLAPTPLENIEKLEQLRLLENGKKVFVSECHEQLVDINTQKDVEKFQELLEHTL